MCRGRPTTRDENRKALTAAERNRTFASAKRVVESAKRAGKRNTPQSADKKTRGRKPKYGKPQPEVAKDLGISVDTLERAEQQVELGERYPWLQSDAWRQADFIHGG